MSVKIKYGTDGVQEAEIILDPNSIQNGKAREDYFAAHAFLTDVLGDCIAPAEKQTSSEKDGVQMSDETRSHNKSKPHYKADRQMAKFIIDAGGLKYLHGVNYIGKTQMFFFDKVPMVQAFIDLYHERNCVTSSDCTQMSRRKKIKKHDSASKEAIVPIPAQSTSESPMEDVRGPEDTGGGVVD